MNLWPEIMSRATPTGPSPITGKMPVYFSERSIEQACIKRAIIREGMAEHQRRASNASR